MCYLVIIKEILKISFLLHYIFFKYFLNHREGKVLFQIFNNNNSFLFFILFKEFFFLDSLKIQFQKNVFLNK